MTHTDAKIMSEIYRINKEQKRGVYPYDLVSRMVIPKGSSQQKFEDLMNKGFLNQEVKDGANVYQVSVLGKEQMMAFRDIRIELEDIAV